MYWSHTSCAGSMVRPKLPGLVKKGKGTVTRLQAPKRGWRAGTSNSGAAEAVACLLLRRIVPSFVIDDVRRCHRRTLYCIKLNHGANRVLAVVATPIADG